MCPLSPSKAQTESQPFEKFVAIEGVTSSDVAMDETLLISHTVGTIVPQTGEHMCISSHCFAIVCIVYC